ncbi:MAG: chromosomal replication initiator protein DnaA [Kiritimatiellae bacterium]|nr:chromosomal replication initiator protein DnaA [Kiritimatiellia bacterium]
MSAAETLWKEACGFLAKVLLPDIYTRWIEIIRPVKMDGNTLVLSVDNDFTRDWLANNHQQTILDALGSAGAPRDLKVEFVVETDDAPTLPEPPAPEPAPKPARKAHPARKPAAAESSPLDPNFTFENFVTGPSNSFACGAALGVCQQPGRAYSPLFIYGETGIGKTHLMQAIGHRILQTDPQAIVRYISSETLLNEYVDSLKNHENKAFRDKYRSTDVLMVDDIQFLAGKTALQEEFFHTFNELHSSRKQIILTSDLAPKDLKGLEPRLVSRFEWGLVTQIECPDFETRLAILRYKQTLSRITLSDPVLTFIAENITSNVRCLEGALNKTLSYLSLTGQPDISIETLRTLLRDQLNNERQKDLSFNEIQRAVAEHYDIRMNDMSSKQRPRSVAGPRQIAMFLCRKLTRASLPDIAKAFDKTHATVLHACKAVQDRMQTEPELSEGIREIVRKLGRDPGAFFV